MVSLVVATCSTLRQGSSSTQLGEDSHIRLLVTSALGFNRQAVHGHGERQGLEIECGRLPQRRAALRRSGSRRPLQPPRCRPALRSAPRRSPCLAMPQQMTDLEWLPAVADVERTVLVDRAWCTRNSPCVPRMDRTVTLNTWASTWCVRIGQRPLRLGIGPSPRGNPVDCLPSDWAAA